MHTFGLRTSCFEMRHLNDRRARGLSLVDGRRDRDQRIVRRAQDFPQGPIAIEADCPEGFPTRRQDDLPCNWYPGNPRTTPFSTMHHGIHPIPQ